MKIFIVLETIALVTLVVLSFLVLTQLGQTFSLKSFRILVYGLLILVIRKIVWIANQQFVAPHHFTAFDLIDGLISLLGMSVVLCGLYKLKHDLHNILTKFSKQLKKTSSEKHLTSSQEIILNPPAKVE